MKEIDGIVERIHSELDCLEEHTGTDQQDKSYELCRLRDRCNVVMSRLLTPGHREYCVRCKKDVSDA